MIPNWRLTERLPWRIPTDNRYLVEAATHPEVLATIEAETDWAEYGIRIDAKALAEGRAGGIVTLDRARPFPPTLPNADEAILTRLGVRGPNFALPVGTVGPFGTPISTVAPIDVTA